MRRADEMSGPRSTLVKVLLFDGQPAGDIIGNIGNSGNFTVTIRIWSGPLRDMPMTTGSAGGWGYDKLSSAVTVALKSAGVTPLVVDHGNGQTRDEFEKRGYSYWSVL